MSQDNLNDNLKSTLSTVPYFAGLDTSLVEVISRQTKQQHYEAGQVVFLEGSRDMALYIVHSGWLKAIKVSPDGREQVLHFIGPGEIFNGLGVFLEATNPATVIALEPTILWSIQQEVILKLLDDSPQLARSIIQHLAKRVQYLINLVEDLSLRTIEARLARYLIEQSRADQLERPQWATQAEMANRLGTVSDVLNRALRNLAKENLIRVERHQIEILDYPGLEARAELDK